MNSANSLTQVNLVTKDSVSEENEGVPILYAGVKIMRTERRAASEYVLSKWLSILVS